MESTGGLMFFTDLHGLQLVDDAHHTFDSAAITSYNVTITQVNKFIGKFGIEIIVFHYHQKPVKLSGHRKDRLNIHLDKDLYIIKLDFS